MIHTISFIMDMILLLFFSVNDVLQKLHNIVQHIEASHFSRWSNKSKLVVWIWHNTIIGP